MTKNININGESACHAGSKGKLTTADTCLTPPYCIPINYTNLAESKMADQTVSSVKIQGNPACNQKSTFKISKGDSPGCCGGVASGSTQQMTKFLEGSSNVTIGGEPAVFNGLLMCSNAENTDQKPLIQPPADKAPVNTTEAPATTGEYSQQFDFANLIGFAPGETKIIERPVYEIWTTDGYYLSTGNLSAQGLTERVYTPDKRDLVVWLGDGEWKVFSEHKHTGYEDEEESPEARSATMKLGFANFANAPIPELEYKLVVDGQEHTGKTDATGKTETLTGVTPGTTVSISVLREIEQTYKEIGQIKANAGESEHAIVSPKIKLEAATEQHLKKEPTPAAPRSGAKTKRATTPSQKELATETRIGADGYPLSRVKQTALDALQVSGALGTVYLKVFLYKTWAQPFVGHHKIVPFTMPSLTKPGTAQSGNNLDRLNNLIDIAEAQVKLDYTQCQRTPGQSQTQCVIDKYTEDKDYDFPVKEDATKPLGKCLSYVKVAAYRAGYANSTSGTGPAKDSGKDWETFDYTDESDNLPKIEVTYRNAYAEKDRPKVEKILMAEKKLENLKGELPTLQQELSKAKKTKDAPKTAAAEKAIADQNRKIEAAEQNLTTAKKDAPEKTTVKHTQPDLMYSLPGDLIVYEKVYPVEIKPDGHIDIRTYHGFCSDFVNPRTIPALGVSGKSRYRVTGIYRKISDSMAMVRVQAFLRIIREHEAKGYKDPYLADHFDGKEHKMFSDMSTHPSDYDENKPAGAYQIKFRTWKGACDMTGWPRVYSNEMQDRLAMYLLQERPLKGMPHPRRSALGYIMEGEVEKAVKETELWNLFSCLPGGKDEQQLTMKELRNYFDTYVSEASK